MSSPGPTPPSPRAHEARFVAEVLVPFVHKALDLALERRADPTPVARRVAGDGLGVDVLMRATWEANVALGQVAHALSLDDIDLIVLVFAVAPYLDPRLGRRYRELQDSVLDDRASVGLVLELLGCEGEVRYLELERFQPEAPLFKDGVLTHELPTGARGDAMVDRVLCAPQRTIDRLLGWPRLDEKLRPYCALERMPVPLENVILPEARSREALSLVRHHDTYREAVRRMGFATAIPYGRGVTLLFAGPPGAGKTLFARAMAHSLGKPLLRVYADRVAETNEAIEPVAQGIFREAAFADAVIFFDECEGLFSKRSSKLAFLLSELERFEGIVVLATNAPHALDEAMDRRIIHRLEFDIPDAEDRLQIWELHLPPGAPIGEDVDLPLLASLFVIPGGAIKNAVLVALNRAIDRDPRAPVLDMALLRAAAEGQLKFNLEDLASKSKIALEMKDLVLPPTERAKIEEIISACRHKDYVQNKWGLGRRLATGKGICILFDGAPGTGKTLCAEILAKALDRSVYRVNVANVMSKWIGETEKNIAEIFQRAKATQAILLFDEADSLFAKRTEVSTANDRFANQEVNLLLQEVERYDGIVVLTTNLFGGLDDALKRRIQYRVTFPRPTAAERLKIWKTIVPREAPLADDVDFAALADAYDFAGGNIKNAVTRACYKAAGDGGLVTMAHFVAACRRESEASGMLFREIVPAGEEAPEPTIEQLERLARLQAEWNAEAARIYGQAPGGGGGGGGGGNGERGGGNGDRGGAMPRTPMVAKR
ncbi:MAG: ATP-binding protein [Deltaproteobacteria bacterium]|nr:ATP-binding protein [Deltaproteobacteria bacterium]